MDVHKPKPIHNWRDFVKEVGIIVLGVSIALAAEQGVEWWHWRSEVAVAREALHEEIISNNRRFYARRVAIAPCLDRQFAQVEAILAGLEAGRRPEKPTTLQPASNASISDGEWQSQRASQVLTHFPHAELDMMNRYYAILPDVRAALSAEGMAWMELSILRNPPAGITTPDLIRLRVNLSIAQRFGNQILTLSRREINLGKRLGLGEAKPDPLLVKYFCSSLTPEEYQRWRALVEGAVEGVDGRP